MKLLKPQFYSLLLATLIMFSSCSEDSQEPEVFTYSINTMAPEIGGEDVTFNARLNTVDDRVTYGFMWYVKDEVEGGTVTTIEVGTGALNGQFSISRSDLPKGKVLVVCAYVNYPVGIESTSEIGEELDFGWD